MNYLFAMRNIILYSLLIFLGFQHLMVAQLPVDLNYNNNETPTYDEVIEAYRYLSETNPNASLREVGITDCGKPLHLFLMGEGVTADKSIQELTEGKTVLLINNGIHPGESSGIDASIEYSKSILAKGVPSDVLIGVIPVYNVGGSLTRGKYFRANQNGPLNHGFRGNARNLDLNRDFIKADALNTRSFYAIFHALRPHLFVDTHTSNGADYQYTISLISSQKDKMNPLLAGYMTNEMEPFLYRSMKDRNWEMTPYVNVFGRVPDDGFSAFLETPRFASGYTTLFNCIGFITETHMLKPYGDRVKATLSFLEVITEYAANHTKEIYELRQQAMKYDRSMTELDLDWRLDTSDVIQLKFKGYEYVYESSELGDYQRLRYLKEKPKNIALPYYPSYTPIDSASIPRYYVIPQAWRDVVQLLQYNQVKLKSIKQDTLIDVVSTFITAHKFDDRAYEGHHPVRNIETKETTLSQSYLAGDYLISTNQDSRRFIVSVLEPRAVDSYLRWNFFDAIFQQKEYFSAYVFEDTAEQLLRDDPQLKMDFEQWKRDNPHQAKSSYGCLEFVYKRSPYYEENHLKYPVSRVF